MLEEMLTMLAVTVIGIVIGSTLSARLIRRGTAKDIEKALREILNEILEREDINYLIKEGGNTFVKVREFIESEDLRKTLESLRNALDKL